MENINTRFEMAEIFYDAFEKKIQNFWFLTNDKYKAIELIAGGIQFEQIIHIKNEANEIVAVATIETNETGHAIDIPYTVFKKKFGLLGGLLRKIAYTVYKNSQESTRENEVYVDLVAVKKSERSKGYGAQLFDEIESHARQLEKFHVKLNVVNNNQAGKRFYEKNGYVEIDYEELNPFFKLFTKRAGFTGDYTMFKDLTTDSI